jgi:hypothetical protein
LGRQAVLVEDVQERKPICHRDPGIAHPDVEIALVFLIRLLRKLGAFGSHPPRVVGLGSHELPSVCPQPQQVMIFLSRAASVRSATHRELFLLRTDPVWNETAPCGLPFELRLAG